MTPRPESGTALPPPGCPAHGNEAAAYALYTPDFAADPWPTYQKMREQGPVVPVEIAPGMRAWLVVDYAAVLEVSRFQETFSRDSRCWRALNDGEIPPDSPMLPIFSWRPHILFTQGQEHQRLRQVIVDSLSRIDPNNLREYVERHADTLIDRFAAAGEAELVEQYLGSLPTLVFAELLGASAELANRMYQAAFRLAAGVDAEAAYAEVAGCLAEVVAIKREHPGNDVPSWMLAHPAGLDDGEIVYSLVILMGMGGSLLQVMMKSALRLLLSDDRFFNDLAGGSLSVDDAIDEVLWNDPPLANHSPHFPQQDLEFHGVRMRKGDLIVLSFAAANTGTSVAADSRAGNRGHLAWGAGPHVCPAQGPARLIAMVAMEKLLDRLPDVELAVPVDKLEWNPGPIYRAPAVLPVRFHPIRSAGPAAPTQRAAAPPAARPESAKRPEPDQVNASTAGMPDRPAKRGAPAHLAGALRRAAGWLSGRRPGR